MPSKRKNTVSGASCQHSKLYFAPSPHAEAVGYERPSSRQLLAAAEISGRLPLKSTAKPVPESTFPAPLVLPGDDLAYDSKARGQSVCAWNRLKERNHISKERSVIYVVPPPSPDQGVNFLKSWYSSKLPQPKVEDVASYLQAFYTGLQVRILQLPELRFRIWEEEDDATSLEQMRGSAKKITLPAIGLQYSKSEVLQVRVRPCADSMFQGQMNLNDIIDACIEILPNDAFAMTMVLPYDLFESEDDDFCCGRAFGGSRVSVVSTARYDPSLDIKQNVETSHAWPASHCQEYIDACCAAHDRGQRKQRKTGKKSAEVIMLMDEDETSLQASPLHAAVNAVRDIFPPDASLDKANLWLSRVCKTTSHELGHCLGIDHCPYYACIMQGTAGLSEDARQPPYLCPIDLAKLLRVTGATETEHLVALKTFCERYRSDRLFRGFDAWIDGRLDQLKAS